MKSTGFMIIELLVYLILLIIISLILMKFVIQTYTAIKYKSSSMPLHISFGNALDMITHDIFQASSNPEEWVAENNLLIMKGFASHIGWKVEDNNLIRQEGIYNFVHQKWQKVHKALVARNIVHFSHQLLLHEKYIDALLIEITGYFNNHEYTLNRYIGLQNKEIL